MSILIIDVGSSSVRTLLFDNDATVISDTMVRRTHTFKKVHPGEATADPVHLRELVEACVDDILQYPQGNNIEAVGMDTFVGNLLGITADESCTPLLTYADMRSAHTLASLKKQVDETEVHQHTGALLHTAYYPAQLKWLLNDQPVSGAKQMAQILDFATYCYRVWFDSQVPMSYSIASWSGMLNREQLTWDAQWINTLGISNEMLPRLADCVAPQQGLCAEYAQRWPQLKDKPFYLAIGDGAAAQIGSGAVAQNTLALTIGTTAALRKVSTETVPPVPQGLWSYRIDKVHHLLGGATSEGGSVFEWATDTLQLASTNIEQELRQRRPDSHGLTFLPLLNGERSPGYWTNASGQISGITLATNPIDIVQAGLEGVAVRLAMIEEKLVDKSEPVQIMASGGAVSASTAWAQMIANAMNRPLQLVDEPEATARGVAILILASLYGRQYSDFEPKIDKVIEPQADNVNILQKAKARHREFYQQYRALVEKQAN